MDIQAFVFLLSAYLLTFGRRPAGQLVVVVVVLGGAKNFYSWAFQIAQVWFQRI